MTLPKFEHCTSLTIWEVFSTRDDGKLLIRLCGYRHIVRVLNTDYTLV